MKIEKYFTGLFCMILVSLIHMPISIFSVVGTQLIAITTIAKAYKISSVGNIDYKLHAD